MAANFLEAEEEESPDVDKNSEMNQLPSVMVVELPALTFDEIENFLISDEMANLPSEPKNPEVTQDSLEQGLVAEQPAEADPSKSLSILGYLEMPQGQEPASGAGSVQNKQTKANEIRLSKEVEEVLKIRLEKVQQSAKENEEKTKSAACKVKEGEDASALSPSPSTTVSEATYSPSWSPATTDSESDSDSSTTTAGCTSPPPRKFVTAQLLVQGELSEYEKIRVANIKEKNELLRTLQKDWQGFKESEGLVAAVKTREKPVKTREKTVKTREKGAKKLKKREARKSPGTSCSSKDVGRPIEKNERQLGVLNQELGTKEAHTNNLQDMSKQVRI